jgi:hypothetical protein
LLYVYIIPETEKNQVEKQKYF